MATSLTLDFPSASLKSSTYVTSPTTWDIQKEKYQKNKRNLSHPVFKSLLALAMPLQVERFHQWSTVSPDQHPTRQHHASLGSDSAPKSQGQRETQLTWEIQKTSTWSVCQKFPFANFHLRNASCPLAYRDPNTAFKYSIWISHLFEKRRKNYIKSMNIHLANRCNSSFNKTIMLMAWGYIFGAVNAKKTSSSITIVIFHFSQT